MDQHTQRRKLSKILYGFVSFVTLVLVTIVLSSCETTFSDKPAAHRLQQALEQWPDEYYWLVETGVSSRVMGIRSRGDSISKALGRIDGLLSKVKEQWDDIGPLDTTEELLDYFRKHDLDPIAKAIESTLSTNQSREPTGEFRQQIQARAIKRGLMFAYREVKRS